MADDLDTYLNELALDDCYRVDAVLKESEAERTERVYLVGRNGAERGPYVRKYISTEDGLGGSYTRIWEAQQQGRRFLHLPRIIECVDGGDRLIVVMEFVPGLTLAEELQSRGAGADLAAELFPPLCDAVRELHEGFDPPIVHRDLTPSNIMVSADNLSIIDFGIARSYKEGAEEDTRHFGTRSYAPPEQFGFGQTDVRSDVYALGALLYYLLVGQAPDAKAREDGFEHPDIPEPLRFVIARACAFDPDARYESVAQLQSAFADALVQVDAAKAGEESMAAKRAERIRASSAPISAHDYVVREVFSSFGNFVGFVLRVLWDILLAVLLILVFIGLVNLSLSESISNGSSLSLELLSVAPFYFLFCCPLVFLMRSRLPGYVIFPNAPRLSIEYELLILIALILLYSFLSQLIPGIAPDAIF